MRIEAEQAVPARSARGDRLLQSALELVQFGVALGVATVVAYAIWTQLPKGLDVRTDIVGYPIYANFNGYRYFWFYWLVAGFIPLATLGLYLALRRVMPREGPWRRPRSRELAIEPSAAPLSGRKLVVVAVARTLFVGAIFGLEVAVAISRYDDWILPVALPVALGYAGVAAVGAFAAGRLRRAPATFWDRLALLNTLGVAGCVGALYFVSHSTEITVAATDELRRYEWLPAWLALGATIGLLVWALRSARRSLDGDALRGLERRFLLLVAGPVVVFLFTAGLPGAGGEIDWFHEGEPLAGGELVKDGAFPWRDLVFIHGLLGDIGVPSVGFAVFEDSRWGYLAGINVLVGPLYWILLYYLYAYLFKGNWIFLAGTQVAFFLGVTIEAQTRFLLMPAVLLLLAAVLSKPTVLRACGFMTLLVAQTIVVPEAAIVALACLATIVVFEAYYMRRRRPVRENFRRTLLCAGAGAVLTVAWLAFLAGFGALDDFVVVNLTFASDHYLTGALPVNWVNNRYKFDAVVPVVLVVLTLWYFALKTLRGRSLSIQDWVMGSSALFVGLYYHKFLSRADEHVYAIFATTIPLLFYVLFKLLSLVGGGLDAILARFRLRTPTALALSAVALVILLVAAPLSPADRIRRVPARLDATVSAEAKVQTAGYTEPEGVFQDLVRNLDTILSAYVGPDGPVFDFSNSPGLFYYLQERPSATRYYHVSTAIRKETQDDLVEELARERPRLVVFSSSATGLGNWDNISNQVRHYRVSEYLLSHYHPLVLWNGMVFMGRNGATFPSAATVEGRLRGTVETEDLYFRTYKCDWGYAPNFLSEQPDSSSPALQLAVRRAGKYLSAAGWAVDPAPTPRAARVVAVVGARVVAEVAPSVPRQDIDKRFGNVALQSGFRLGVPSGGPRALRLYALSGPGTAAELRYGPGVTGVARGFGPRTFRYGDRRVRIVAGSAQGFVDSTTELAYAVTLDLPPRTRARDYRWLEVETVDPLRSNGFLVTDDLQNPDRGMGFKALDGKSRTVRLRVGACSQWYGYRGRRLYLQLTADQEVAAVRLYR